MAKTAYPGPLVSFGNRQNPAEGGSNNPDQGPNSSVGGLSFLDTRVGYNVGPKGWVGAGVDVRRVLSAVPAALGATNISAAANAANGVPVTLAAASTGVTVVPAGGLYVFGSGNTVPAGCLVLDGNPAVVKYGLADSNGNYNNKTYDVTSMLSRCLSVTGVAGGAGGSFTVSGYDVYGYPLTQTLVATAGATVVATLKAFKFIKTITPLFTDAHNYSFGTTDVFGLPLRATLFDECLIWWNSALITANAGFVAAVTTNPSTAALGDVRGTYAVQSASDGAKRLTISVGPGQSALSGSLIFGQAQV